MTPKKISKILTPILWDTTIDPFVFYSLAIGEGENSRWLNQQSALIRIFERLNWYELIELFGIDLIKKHLTKNLIKKLRFPEMRERYEFIRKVLQGEVVSFSGWDTEASKQFKNTLLSDRWYRVR